MSFDKYRELFQQGCKLIDPYMILQGQPKQAPVESKVLAGIQLLEDAILHNATWPAWWVIGKGYQCILRHDQAANAFHAAWKLAYKEKRQELHADVLREWETELMVLGKFEAALEVTILACEVSPDDPGLQANHALVLVFLNRLAEARDHCLQAHERDPQDEITAALLAYIDEMIVGTKPVPKNVTELQRVGNNID